MQHETIKQRQTANPHSLTLRASSSIAVSIRGGICQGLDSSMVRTAGAEAAIAGVDRFDILPVRAQRFRARRGAACQEP